MRIARVSATLAATVAACIVAQAPAVAQTAVAAVAASSAAPAKAAAPAAKKVPAAKAESMDLRAPPLSHVMPRQQLQYILAVDTSDQDAEEVSVRSPRYVVPVPVGQFYAVPWALMHPTDAWRVFTPVESP